MKDEKGGLVVDEVLSQPVTRVQAKLTLSKYTQTAKQRAAEMSGESGSGSQKKSTTIEDIRSKFKLDY